MRVACAFGLLVVVLCLGGCGAPADVLNDPYTKPEMLNKGIVYILPGIQGVDYHYLNMRKGLQGAGLQCAIKIHPWGCHIRGIGLLINETDTTDDRGWGRRIAAEIADYQSKYPGRPVYLIGQSAGCGVSVFAAEAMAAGGAAPVSGIILLDASLGADYNLTTAIGQSRKGMVNFYNLRDVAMLEVGTDIFGNVDGTKGDSAGRIGFATSPDKLYQVRVQQDMVSSLENPHFADTSSAFTTNYIAPWVVMKNWPPRANR